MTGAALGLVPCPDCAGTGRVPGGRGAPDTDTECRLCLGYGDVDPTQIDDDEDPQ